MALNNTSKKRVGDVSSTQIPQLDQSFWNSQYLAQTTGWDLGVVSPPLKFYIDQLTDKDLRILIPGCGNSYEAAYLLEKGFNQVTVIDIAPEPVAKLRKQFGSDSRIRILEADFFTHQGEYDLVLEQTFFCALDPVMRPAYVKRMKELLVTGGRLVGVLFNREFDKQGPPFGGSAQEYNGLFEADFRVHTFEICYNSFSKRADTELFINLRKK